MSTWYEIVTGRGTTEIVLIHDDGSYYIPNSTNLSIDEVRDAQRNGRAHRLVREEALREHIATEIEVEMRRHDHAQIGFSAVGDAYAHAARIVRGEQS